MRDRERIQTKASSIPTNAFNQAETGLFRKRPFAVQAETETDTDAHPLPDLQTQLERGARFNESISRMKVYGNRPVIQPKIAIGAPGDKYEQEADQVAERVMNMKAPTANPQPVQRQQEEQAEESVQMQPLAASKLSRFSRCLLRLTGRWGDGGTGRGIDGFPDNPTICKLDARYLITPFIQRDAQLPEEEEDPSTVAQMKQMAGAIQRDAKPPEEEEDHEAIAQTKPSVQRAGQEGGFQADPNIESRLASQKGGGSPLSDEVRSFMEPRFGADFSQVRVHTDSNAVQMNQALGAQAFTHGSDIYYGAGKSPGISDLTAHELTHVVQQTGNQIHRHPEGAELSVNSTGEVLPAAPQATGTGGAAPTPASTHVLSQAQAQSILQSTYGNIHTIVPGNIVMLADTNAAWAQYDQLCIAGNVTNNFVTPARPWQNGDAQARFPAGLNGFQWQGSIYINQQTAIETTTPHEMLHLNTAPGFRRAVGETINEGSTQYLTLKALNAAGIAVTGSIPYADEVDLVRALVALVGEDTLIQAYFNGAINQLIGAVDLSQGEGTFATLKQLGDAREFARAKDLLKPGGGTQQERQPIDNDSEVLV